jgi:SAM-dependent methyltransferase
MDPVNTEKKIDLNDINNEIMSNIRPLLKSVKKNDEFEVGFRTHDYKITLEKYTILLKYLINKSRENPDMKLEKNEYLNISYNYDYQNMNNYRITVNGLENINSHISQIFQRENHVIFSILLNKMCNGDKNISIMKKIKDKKNIIDLDFLRFRLSTEDDITKQETHKLLRLTEKERKYINYRYIQRISLIILDNEELTLRIDLSQVKNTDKIKMLEKAISIIELEIDVSFKKQVSEKKIKEILEIISKYLIELQQVIQKSKKLVSKSLQNEVVIDLKKLIFVEHDINIKDLPAMHTQAAEIPHIVDIIPNKYTVSDKADGERTFIFISNNNLYMITNILEVKQIEHNYKNIGNFNNTILDGEYIYIQKYKKFIFLVFDILYYKGEEMRTQAFLEKRYEKIYDITNGLFKQETKKPDYKGNFDLEKISEYHYEGITKFINEINDKLENGNNDNIIMAKYIIFPLGGHPCEIFKYSSLIWNIFTINKDIQIPYQLDGLIYTGIEQIYTRNIKETKYRIYKWKPGSKNSIDFYVLYERNKDTNQILNVYDDSEQNEDIDNKTIFEDGSTYKKKGAIYRILNLYVGKVEAGREYPILFQKQDNNYIANLYIQDDYVRDIEGNIIEDATVVEFSYINDPTIKAGFRWVPLRTRYDKTDSVNIYRRKYGNNNEIADKTWRSIMDGIEISDIELLGNESSYELHNKKLKSKITTDVITMERRENIYYQVITNLAKPLRNFHNWIKSNLIFTYCSPKQGKKLDVLDYGCGVGGDTLKFYHARVASYVGFDYDSHGIYSGSNGALSRYQTFKKKMPNFPKMNFLVADGGALLTYEDQKQALGTMTEQNKKIILEIFGDNYKTFDVINCQFVIHYFFKNDITLNNVIQNFKKFTRPSGYVLITTMDAFLVNASFDENNKIISHYTTSDGNKKILFDVIKKYDSTNLDKTGLAIGVHLPAFEDDKYETEYLVSPNLLINRMIENEFNLIDTGYFGNVYEQHRDFFESVARGEENEQNKKYYMGVKEYYNMNDTENKGSYQFSKLNRYYVFQKQDSIKEKYVYKKK